MTTKATKDRRALWRGRIWSILLLVISAAIGAGVHALRGKGSP